MKSWHQLICFCVLASFSRGRSEDLVELVCNVNSDCNYLKRTDYNTTCLDGHCICSNVNGESIPCKPMDSKLNNFIGGTCPCIQANAECNRQESICYCKKDFVPSFDRRRCIKKNLVLGENCEDNSQCLGLDRFAECHLEMKKCVCQKNFIEHSGICISVVGLESRCLDNTQCLNHTANSMCYSNTCICLKGFTASKDLKCLPFADYNETCREDNQCKHKLGAGSECYADLCSCDVKHFGNQVEEPVGGKRYICERKIVRGDYCRDHNDCYQFHLQASQQSMECFFGECNCRPGFENVDEVCIKSGATPPQEAPRQLMLILSLFISVFLFKLN